MGRRKVDEDQLAAAVARYHAGETAGVVAATLDLSVGHFRRLLKRRDVRLRDLPPEEGRHWTARKGKAGRADAETRVSNSLLSEAQWEAVLALRDQGLSNAVLGRRFGVSPATVQYQAKARGRLRRDNPQSRGAPRGDSAIGAAVDDPAERDWMRFDYVSGDPEATQMNIDAAIARATAAGRLDAAMALGRTAKGLRGVGAPAPSASDGGAAPSTLLRQGFGGSPSPSPDVGRDRRPPGQAGGTSRPDAACDGEETSARPPLVLRPSQRPPEGEWATWLFLGGRGAGKTLAGASWLADQAEALGPGGRLALIGPTLHDVREVMIEGPSGLKSLPRWVGADGAWDGPRFEPSRRRVRFPGGATAFAFSAEDPDSLRGPQFSAAWADEFCAWPRGEETLALLRMGLRLPLKSSPSGGGGPAEPVEGVCRELEADEGLHGRLSDPLGGSEPHRSPSTTSWSPSSYGGGVCVPRLVVTTTPRPTRALKGLRAEASCAETHAGTRDNAEHLAPGFLEELEALYGGTRRAAQELDGRVVEPDGALWRWDVLEGCRGTAPGSLTRTVVAIDPSVTRGGNACGIVVAGKDAGGACWVLADCSAVGLTPMGWARAAVAAAERWKAGAVVVEVNQGGEMVTETLRAAGCGLRLKAVRASKGKRARAEPVAALYEQGKVRHAGVFGALEEELLAFGGEEEGRLDLDRADALVWAVTELMLGDQRERGPRIRVLSMGPEPAARSPWTGNGWGARP